jgi:hypothetical protein
VIKLNKLGIRDKTSTQELPNNSDAVKNLTELNSRIEKSGLSKVEYRCKILCAACFFIFTAATLRLF